MSESATFPNLEEICINKGLYDEIKIHEQQIEGFKNSILLSREEGFDAYCVDCNKESHFKGTLTITSHDLHVGIKDVIDLEPKSEIFQDFIENGFFEYVFKCSRNHMHKMAFYFHIKEGSIFKVGQHPSLADLQFPDLRKYRKLLSDNDYREFKKAVGLNAHGIGIGSFAYLRRIFERLVEAAHTQAKHNAEWDEESYSQARMSEKIDLLQEYLPDFLVAHKKSIYGVLSKGIHELEEEECKKSFGVVKTVIELILDEKMAQDEKIKKTQIAAKQINELSQKYND